MNDTPVIEAQLLRWSESHNGRTVTLQLPADGEHPFRGLPCGPANGARLAIAIARIADDETTTPVEPPSTAPEKPKGGGNGDGHRLTKGGRRAREAGIACNEGRFWRFLDECVGRANVTSPGLAAEAVRGECNVTTRADLDHDVRAGHAWDRIHSKYLAWQMGL